MSRDDGAEASTVADVRDDDLFAILESLAPDEVIRRRREAVTELRDHGWTMQAIADRLGVTRGAVNHWVNRG